MSYNRFFFVSYWFAPFLKVGPLPSENPRCAPDVIAPNFILKAHPRETFVKKERAYISSSHNAILETILKYK